MGVASLKDWYYKRILRNVPFVLEHFDEAKGFFSCGDGKDRLCWHGLRPLAFLYKNKLPANPWYGDKSVLDKIIRQGGKACEAGEISGGDLGVEWIPYNLMECIEWLSDELGEDRVARWRRAISAHLNRMKLVSNYISTAPNHFVWRAALLFRAGQLFENESWRLTAQFIARQVTKMQTVDGYWDEAHRGQGPSPNYHRTMLHGLDLYYRFSGDEEVRDALYKGIDFAVRAAYPDGTPMEVFDGRQPYLAAFAVGMAANALTRTARGRRLVRNQCARLDELGVTDAASPVGFALSWYVFATTDFMIDCYRFIEDGEENPLPQEMDGYEDAFVFNGREGEGGGLVEKRGTWLLAASAAETDVPRFIDNVYIAERQSGFSVYHDAAGLVIGGGNRMRDHVPFANAIVLTGWEDVDCHAGAFPDDLVANNGLPAREGDGRGFAEHNDPVKSTYHPIRRSARHVEGGVELDLDFLHAHVRFTLVPVGEGRLEIRYAFESVEVPKLLLQLPVPLFHPGLFEADGEQYEAYDFTRVHTIVVKRELSLKARGRTVRYGVGANVPYRYTYALEPIKNWTLKGLNYLPDMHFLPLYTVGMLSAEFKTDRSIGLLASVEVE